MRQVEFFKWWLPPAKPKGKPYLSSWEMDAEQAAQRGAIRPEPSTRIVRKMAETPEEEVQLRRLSDTSHLGS
jgi:hypothetical protein